MEKTILDGLTQLSTAGIAIVVLAYLLYAFRKDASKERERSDTREDKHLEVMDAAIKRLSEFNGNIQENTKVTKEVATLLHQHHKDTDDFHKDIRPHLKKVHLKPNNVL